MPPTPPPPTKKTYRYMGNHATELSIGNSLPWIGEGDFIDLGSGEVNDVKIQNMIDSGLLVDISTIKADPEVEPTAATQSSDEEGGK
jgi:hypothetical protein